MMVMVLSLPQQYLAVSTHCWQAFLTRYWIFSRVQTQNNVLTKSISSCHHVFHTILPREMINDSRLCVSSLALTSRVWGGNWHEE